MERELDDSTLETDSVDGIGDNADTGERRRAGFFRNLRGDSGQSETDQREATSRKPGRPRLPRDGDGNIIRSRNTAGNGSVGDDRNRSGDGDNGSAETTETPGTVGETARVESPKGTPKRGRPRKAKGVIQPEHVERWVTQGFSLAAMLKNAEHWKVQNPDVEIRPWAPEAADILNQIDPKIAERTTQFSAMAAVLFGMGTMVYVRLQQDIAYRNHLLTTNQTQTESPLQTNEPVNFQTRRPAPGSGASSVHPTEKIQGLGDSAVGL